MFGWYEGKKSWLLNTGNFSGTIAIGLSFVFIAYVLHPAVEKAYQRVRAYRGWRAIETSQTVEVTTYPLVSEIFGGRGKWDAARIVAILLAAFSLASWGLELQLDLYHIDGFVTDLFLRPPPVWKNGTDDAWHVIRLDRLKINEGEVDNMYGNFSIGTARARYEVNNDTKKIIGGKVRIASWDTDVENIKKKLFYNDSGEGIETVTSHNCTSNETAVDLYVNGEKERWGTVIECKNGPARVNDDDGDSTPNVLKLTNGTTGYVHFIVEESSTYPSFLYSVWEAQNDTDGSSILSYVFHISSSFRLAEAVVTEIVHADRESRVPTGGRSFALLRVFSENNKSYDTEDRAYPFGEHPTGEQPVDIRLSTIETIEKGVKLNTTALLCAVWLMVLTLVGIAWSLLLRSSIEIDIYDRDELIRAVTLAGSADGTEHPSKMRIFVRKEEGGNLRVVISDTKLHPKSCLQRCRKKHEVVAINDPMPKYPSYDPSESDGPVVPNRTRTVWLEGVRMGKGRAYPGRRGNYRYPTSIALIASPVPSSPVSIAGTPVHQLASPAGVPARIRQFPGVNPALFASMRLPGSSEENDGDVEMITAGSNEKLKANSCIEMGYPSPRRSESHQTEIPDLRTLRLFSESTSTLHDRSLMSPSVRLSARSAFKTPERSGPSPTDPGEEVKDDPNDYSEAGVAETEGDMVHDGDDELV